MIDITKSGILNSFKKVDDKSFSKDLLTLNSIKNIETNEDDLIVDFSLPISQA